MTVFVILCAAMLAAALLWITLPLLRVRGDRSDSAAIAAEAKQEDSPGHTAVGNQEPLHRADRGRLWSVVVAACVSALAVAMYAVLSNWDWKAAQTAQQNQATAEELLVRLEQKLAEHPQDVTGWLLLGRSNASLERYARAVDAYQRAYDLSGGENIEAVVGLAEALVMVDEASLGGKAGKLFEEALAKAPNNPKALWYASVAALRGGNLPLARERLQLLLAQNPPPELRTVLEREIQDLDQQLGQAAQRAGATPNTPQGTTATAAPGAESVAPPVDGARAASAGQQRMIRAAVTISPEIQKQLHGPVTLFVLARDPAAPGPPLAVQRRSSTEIPLTVELTERDAMMPSHSRVKAARVEVVARLSQSGTPQARSGDFFGSADYDFSKDTGTVHIVIDRTVP